MVNIPSDFSHEYTRTVGPGKNLGDKLRGVGGSSWDALERQAGRLYGIFKREITASNQGKTALKAQEPTGAEAPASAPKRVAAPQGNPKGKFDNTR
jgi:hypothetical protein